MQLKKTSQLMFTILIGILVSLQQSLYIHIAQSKKMAASLTVKYKGKEIFMTVDTDKTVRQIKQYLYIHTKIPVIQQELSYKEGQTKIVLKDNEKNLKFIKITDNTLHLKNLGLQIKWEHVFYVQYLGPIFILPIFYLLGKKQFYTPIHTIALFMGILHFLKRQYETAYVHIFSRQSMPYLMAISTITHYWIFFALFNGIQLYLYPSGQTYSKPVLIGLVALWVTFELLNYKCHKILGDFRRIPKRKAEGYYNLKKARQIPYGFGFEYVSCANYLWQALGWIVFSILTRNYTAYFFTILAILMMVKWAKEKHNRYLKEFKDAYPKERKAMFPFLF